MISMKFVSLNLRWIFRVDFFGGRGELSVRIEIFVTSKLKCALLER